MSAIVDSLPTVDNVLRPAGTFQIPALQSLSSFSSTYSKNLSDPSAVINLFTDIFNEIAGDTNNEENVLLFHARQLAPFYFSSDVPAAYRTLRLGYNLNFKSDMLWGTLRDRFSTFSRTNPSLSTNNFGSAPGSENLLNDAIDFVETIVYNHSENAQQNILGIFDTVKADPGRSILSPAAYLVDLLRLVSSKTEGFGESQEAFENFVNNLPDPSGEKFSAGDDPRFFLRYRRPDIYDLVLNADNTFESIPYLQIVNKCLANVVLQASRRDKTFPDAEDANSILAASVFPLNLPFNPSLNYLRRLLTGFDIKYYEVIRTTKIASPIQQFSFPSLTSNQASQELSELSIREVQELLNLSPVDYDIIKTEVKDPFQIASYYGVTATTKLDLQAFLSDMTDVNTFLGRTMLSRDELKTLLYQDLTESEIASGLPRQFFINAVDDGLGYLQIKPIENRFKDVNETFENLSFAKLDRIHRFLRLRRRLDWSVEDLDWALHSLRDHLSDADGSSTNVSRALLFDGLNDYVTVPMTTPDLFMKNDMTVEVWVQPRERSSEYPKSQSDIEVLLGYWTDDSASTVIGETSSQRGSKPTPVFNQNLKAKWLLFLNAQKQVCFWASTSTSSQPMRMSDAALLSDRFSHVSVHLQGSQVRVLINGRGTDFDPVIAKDIRVDQLLEIPEVPVADVVEKSDFILARLHFGRYFSGIIKEVRIWNEFRTEEIIRQKMFSSFTGLEESLLGYWPMCETVLSRVLDHTVFKNHGRLGGGSRVSIPSWDFARLRLDSTDVFSGVVFDDKSGVSKEMSATFVGDSELQDAFSIGNDNSLIFSLWVSLIDLDVDHTSIVVASFSNGNITSPEVSQLTLAVTKSKFTVKSVRPSGSKELSFERNVAVDDIYFVSFAISAGKGMYIRVRPDSKDRKNWSFLADATVSSLRLDKITVGTGIRGRVNDLKIWKSEEITFNTQDLLSTTLTPLSHWPMTSSEVSFNEEDQRFEAADIELFSRTLLGRKREEFSPVLSETETDYNHLLSIRTETNPGTVLHCDSKTAILISDGREDKSFGLGALNEGTLSFLFMCSEISPFHKQLLLSSGDDDVGLVVYVQENKYLVVNCWGRVLGADGKTFDRTQIYGFSKDTGSSNTQPGKEITPKAWNRVTLSFTKHVDDPSLFELKAFLNESEIGTIPFAPLPPIGDIMIAGVPDLPDLAPPQWIGFLDDQGELSSFRDKIYFSGSLTSFMIWSIALGAEELPLLERIGISRGEDKIIADVVLNSTEKESNDTGSDNSEIDEVMSMRLPLTTTYSGALLPFPLMAHIYRNKTVYVTVGENELTSSYAIHKDVVSNAEFILSGKIRCTADSAAIGVLLHRIPSVSTDGISYHKGVALIGNVNDDSINFSLVDLPSAVVLQNSNTESIQEVVHPVEKWTNFRIRSTKVEENRKIEAKLWVQGGTEPDDYSMTNTFLNIDDGVVGLLGFGNGKKMFDNVFLSTNGQGSALFFDGFEEDKTTESKWGFLKTNIIPFSGESTPISETCVGWGLESKNHLKAAFFKNAGEKELKNLKGWGTPGTKVTVYGKIMFGNDLGAVGICIGDTERTGDDPFSFNTLRLVRRPYNTKSFGIPGLKDPYLFRLEWTDSQRRPCATEIQSIRPTFNRWNLFEFEFSFSGGFVNTSLRMWELGSARPDRSNFERRNMLIRCGIVGLMSAGEGGSYFQVASSHIAAEKIETVNLTTNYNEDNWVGRTEDLKDFGAVRTKNALFGSDYDGAIGSQIIYCPHIVSKENRWISSVNHTNYELVGRVLLSDASSSFGFSIQNRVPVGENSYYDINIRAFEQHIDVFKGFGDRHRTMRSTFSNASLDTASGWNNFSLIVSTDLSTKIDGKIWKQETIEPIEPAFSYDDNTPLRITSGTFGMFSNSSKTIFEELKLRHRAEGKGFKANVSEWTQYGVFPHKFFEKYVYVDASYSAFEEVEDQAIREDFKLGPGRAILAKPSNLQDKGLYAISNHTMPRDMTIYCKVVVGSNGGIAGLLFNHYNSQNYVTCLMIQSNTTGYQGKPVLGSVRLSSFAPAQSFEPSVGTGRFYDFGAASTRAWQVYNIKERSQLNVRVELRTCTGWSISYRRFKAKIWPVGTAEPDSFVLFGYLPDLKTSDTFGFYSRGPGDKLFSDIRIYKETDIIGEEMSGFNAWIDEPRFDASKLSFDSALFRSETGPDIAMDYVQKIQSAPITTPLRLLTFSGSTSKPELPKFLSAIVPGNSMFAYTLQLKIERPLSDFESYGGPILFSKPEEWNVELFIKYQNNDTTVLLLNQGTSEEHRFELKTKSEISVIVNFSFTNQNESIELIVSGDSTESRLIQRTNPNPSLQNESTLFIGKGKQKDAFFRGHMYELLLMKQPSTVNVQDYQYMNHREIVKSAYSHDALIASWPDYDLKGFSFGEPRDVWSPAVLTTSRQKLEASLDKLDLDSKVSILFPDKSSFSRGGIAIPVKDVSSTGNDVGFLHRARTIQVVFKTNSSLDCDIFTVGAFQLSIRKGALVYSVREMMISIDIRTNEWYAPTLVWSSARDMRSGSLFCFLNGYPIGTRAGKLSIGEGELKECIIGGGGFLGAVSFVATYSKALHESTIRKQVDDLSLIEKSDTEVYIDGFNVTEAATEATFLSSGAEVGKISSRSIPGDLVVSDEETIGNIAFVQELNSTTNLTIDQVIASFGPVKDYGGNFGTSFFNSLFQSSLSSSLPRWSVDMEPLPFSKNSSSRDDLLIRGLLLSLRSISAANFDIVSQLISSGDFIDGAFLQNIIHVSILLDCLDVTAEQLQGLLQLTGLQISSLKLKNVLDLKKLILILNELDISVDLFLRLLRMSTDPTNYQSQLQSLVSAVIEDENNIKLLPESFEGGGILPNEATLLIGELNKQKETGDSVLFSNFQDSNVPDYLTGLIKNDIFNGSSGISYGDNYQWAEILYNAFNSSMEIELRSLFNAQILASVDHLFGSVRNLLKALYDSGLLFGVPMFRSLSDGVVSDVLNAVNTEVPSDISTDSAAGTIYSLLANVFLPSWAAKAISMQQIYIRHRDSTLESLFRSMSTAFETDVETIQAIFASGIVNLSETYKFELVSKIFDTANSSTSTENDVPLGGLVVRDISVLSTPEADLLKAIEPILSVISVIKPMQFSAYETFQLLLNPQVFGVTSQLTSPDFFSLISLLSYMQLRRYIINRDEFTRSQPVELTIKLVTALKASSSSLTSEASKLLSMDMNDIEWLQDQTSFGKEATSLSMLWFVQRVQSVAAEMSINVQSLWPFSNNTSVLDFEQSLETTKSGFQNISESTFKSVTEKIDDELLEITRDALLGLAISKMDQDDVPPSKYNLASTVLGEYILLDVKTSARVLASPVQQAIQSVQLYVQRTLLGLERPILIPNTLRAQWDSWLQAYRVWEAARRVYLYPENYIQPDLLPSRTYQYTELIEEVSNGASDESVSKALNNYIQSVSNVLSNLRICGAGYSSTSVNGNADEEKRLVIVGASKSIPQSVFVRQRITRSTKHEWTTWYEVNQTIDEPWISPAYAFGTVFLFWVKWTEVSTLFYIFNDTQWMNVTKDDTDLKNQGREIVDLNQTKRYIVEASFIDTEKNNSELQNYPTVSAPLVKPEVQYTSLSVDGTWSVPQRYNITGIELIGEVRISSATIVPGQHTSPEFQRLYCIPSTVGGDNGSNQSPRIIKIENPNVLNAYSTQVSVSLFPVSDSQDNDNDNDKNFAIDVLGNFSIKSDANFEEPLKSILSYPVQSFDEVTSLRDEVEPFFKDSIELFSLAAFSSKHAVVAHLDWSDPVLKLDRALREWKTNIPVEVPDDTEETRNANDERNRLLQINQNLFNDYIASAEGANVKSLLNSDVTADASSVTRANLYKASFDLKKHKDYESRGSITLKLKNGDQTFDLADLLKTNSWLHIAISVSTEPSIQVLINQRELGDSSTVQTKAQSPILQDSIDSPLFSVGGRIESPILPLKAQLSEARLWSVSSISDVNFLFNLESDDVVEQFRISPPLSIGNNTLLDSTSLDQIFSKGGEEYEESSGLTVSQIEFSTNDFDSERIFVILNNRVLSVRQNNKETGEILLETPSSNLYHRALQLVPFFGGDNENPKAVIRSEPRTNLSFTTRGEKGGRIDFFSGETDYKISADTVRQRARGAGFTRTEILSYKDSSGREIVVDDNKTFETWSKLKDEKGNLLNVAALIRALSNSVNQWIAQDLSWRYSTLQEVQNVAGMFILETQSEVYLIEQNKKNISDKEQRLPVIGKYATLFRGNDANPQSRLQFNFPSDLTSPGDESTYDTTIQKLSSQGAAFFLETLTKLGFDGLYEKETDNPNDLSLQAAKESGIKFIRYPGAPTDDSFTVIDETNVLTIPDSSRVDLYPLSGGSIILDYASWILQEDGRPTDEASFFKDISSFQIIDFEGVNSRYYWELFMHIPMLIASTFNAAGEYQTAMKWMEYIYRPVRRDWRSNNSSYVPWFFIPFRDEVSSESGTSILLKNLENVEAVDAFRRNPFDPHSIAALRSFTYPKFIFQSYIGNLLDWGDSLFVDSRESINQALIFYFQAAKILGNRPNSLEDSSISSDTSARTIEHLRDPLVQPLGQVESNHLNGNFVVPLQEHIDDPVVLMLSFYVPENDVLLQLWDTVEDRLFKIRNSLNIEGVFRQLDLFNPPIDPAALVSAVAGGASPLAAASDLNRSVPHYRYDFILEQAQAAAEMAVELAGEMLEAIENRDEEQLSLLEAQHAKILSPFIIEASRREYNAARFESQGIESNIAHLQSQIDQYNEYLNNNKKVQGTFNASDASTTEPLITVNDANKGIQDTNIGSSQLTSDLSTITADASATEEADRNNFLQILRTEQTARSATQLSLSKTNRNFRSIRNAKFGVNVANSTVKSVFKGIEISFRGAAAIASLFPKAEVGVAGLGPLSSIEVGGGTFQDAAGHAADASGNAAELSDLVNDLVQEVLDREQEKAEWKTERDLLTLELREAENSLYVAKESEAASKAELDLSIAEGLAAAQIADVVKNKFTNVELYSWLSRELKRMYRKQFNAAVSTARSAERCLQFELPTDRSFVSGGGWNDTRAGLLAARNLQKELSAMDTYRIEQDSRFLEIERFISMRREFQDEFKTLIRTGSCEVSFREKLFDRDYPGHFFRVLKNVAVSVIPKGNGRIEQEFNLNATLTQTSNRTVMTNNFQTVLYLWDDIPQAPTPDSSQLRSNLRANQTVALTKWRNDTGMFVVDYFFDDRYFSFEGTGAVSTWTLSIPRISNPGLASTATADDEIQLPELNFEDDDADDTVDIQFLVRYSSKADFGSFKDDVEAKVKTELEAAENSDA